MWQSFRILKSVKCGLAFLTEKKYTFLDEMVYQLTAPLDHLYEDYQNARQRVIDDLMEKLLPAADFCSQSQKDKVVSIYSHLFKSGITASSQLTPYMCLRRWCGVAPVTAEDAMYMLQYACSKFEIHLDVVYSESMGILNNQWKQSPASGQVIFRINRSGLYVSTPPVGVFKMGTIPEVAFSQWLMDAVNLRYPDPAHRLRMNSSFITSGGISLFPKTYAKSSFKDAHIVVSCIFAVVFCLKIGETDSKVLKIWNSIVHHLISDLQTSRLYLMGHVSEIFASVADLCPPHSKGLILGLRSQLRMPQDISLLLCDSDLSRQLEHKPHRRAKYSEGQVVCNKRHQQDFGVIIGVLDQGLKIYYRIFTDHGIIATCQEANICLLTVFYGPLLGKLTNLLTYDVLGLVFERFDWQSFRFELVPGM